MPQENQVVRCYSCLTFQVHLVKKQKKWQCKMCNIKQSLKQIYGKGSGKDCRLHVMKLNELQFSGVAIHDCDVTDVNEHDVQDDNLKTETFTMNYIKNGSKWSQYMNKADETSDEEEIDYKIMETGCSYNKKRKLNNHFAYSNDEMSFELTSKHKCQSNVKTERTEGTVETENKKHEEIKKYDITFYTGPPIKSGSKWSAFMDKEQCSSDEECKNKTEALFINEIESSKNRSQDLHQKSVNMEKLNEGDFEENPVLTANKKCMKGNLKILETLHDDDDLDEILNI